MAKMNAPEMEVVRFANEDVVAASVELLNFSNGAAGDGNINVVGLTSTYNPAANPMYAKKALAEKYGWTDVTEDNVFFTSTVERGVTYSIKQLFNNDSTPANYSYASGGYWFGGKENGKYIFYHQ